MISEATYEYITKTLTKKILAEKEIAETLKYASGNRKPSKGVTAHLSDVIEKHMYRSKDKYILVSEQGDMYAYGGRGWERIEQNNFMRELIKRILTEMGVSVTYKTYSVDKIATECMSGLTASDSTLFEPSRRYICFTNGVFDLAKGELKDFHPRYMTEINLDFPFISDKNGYLDSYEGSKMYRLWDQKLGEIFDNREFRDAFQLFCGSLLASRDTFKVNYICYLEGPGANGKSVAAHAVANVFGRRYFSKYSPMQLIKGNQKERYVADLSGKICNLCDDMDEKTLSGGDFKRLVSGEEIQGMAAYARRPILVTPPLFLCCTNNMPRTEDDSWGHHRRQLRLLTTRLRFGEDREKDPRLTEKLAEVPCKQRIFNWMYQGYRKVLAKGGEIELSADVKQAMIALMEDSTPMQRWAADKGISKKKGKDRVIKREWRKLSDLWTDYSKWSKENGVSNKKLDSRDLSSFLKGFDFESKRLSDGVSFYI